LERLVAYLRLFQLPAAAEQRQYPRYRASPLVVTTQAGRRLLAVSPQAQARGLRPGMSLWEARYRCPQVVALPEDQEKYRYFFSCAVELVGEYTPVVEPLPLEGIFSDLTGTGLLLGPPQQACRQLLARLRREWQLPACCGLGPNKLAARLAAALGEPAQVRHLGQQDLAREVAPLPLTALPGLAPAWRSRLGALGLRTLGEVAALPDQALLCSFGGEGLVLARLARGEDVEPVRPCHLPPSRRVQEVLPLEPGTDHPELLRAAALALCERLGRRLRQRGQAARALHVALGFRNHQERLLRHALPRPSALDADLFAAACALLGRLRLEGRQVCLLRLAAVGLQAERAGDQLAFAEMERLGGRGRRLAAAMDAICSRYGERLIGRAGARVPALRGTPKEAPTREYPPAARMEAATISTTAGRRGRR